MREQHMPNHGKNVSSVMTILQGGHGGTTAAEARTNLQVFGTAEVDVANGIASLKGGKVLPTVVDTSLLSLPGIYGPTSVRVGSETLFNISNYDSFTKYTASAQKGSVALTDKGLMYYAPGAAVADVITFEGRQFPITVFDTGAPSAKPTTLSISVADADNYRIEVELELGGLNASNTGTYQMTSTAPVGLMGVKSEVIPFTNIWAVTIPKNWVPLSGTSILIDVIRGGSSVGSASFDVARPDSSASNKWIQRIVASRNDLIYPGCTSVRFHMNGTLLTISPVFYQKVWTPYVQNPKVYKKGARGDFRLAATLPLSQRGYGYRSLSFSPSGQYLFASDTPYIDPSQGRGDIFGVAQNGDTIALTFRYSIPTVVMADPGGNGWTFATQHFSCVHKWLKGGVDRLFYGDDSRHANISGVLYSLPVYTVDDVGASAVTNRTRFQNWARTNYIQNGTGLSTDDGDNAKELADYNIAENSDGTRLATLGPRARAVVGGAGATAPTIANGGVFGFLTVMNNANGVLTHLSTQSRGGANRFGDGIAFIGNDIVTSVATISVEGGTYAFANLSSGQFTNPRFAVHRASDNYVTIYATANLSVLSSNRISDNSWTRIIKPTADNNGFYAVHYDMTNTKFFLVKYTFASGLLTAAGVDILFVLDLTETTTRALFGDGSTHICLSCDIDPANRIFALSLFNRFVVDIFQY